MTEIERASYTPFFNGLISDVVSVPIGESRKMLFLSGVVALDQDGKPFKSNTPQSSIEEQTRYVWKRIGEILAHHNAKYSDIVKITTYVTDARFFPMPLRAILKEIFAGGPLPVSTSVVVAGLAYPELLVEIDATAIV